MLWPVGVIRRLGWRRRRVLRCGQAVVRG